MPPKPTELSENRILVPAGMGHLLRNGLHVELEPGVSGSGLALKSVQDSSEAAHAGHAASCLASIVRLTLPHDDDHTATTTRTSVTGTGDNGAARQQGRASTSPPPLSLFLFPISGHGSSVRVALFLSFGVQPLRGSTHALASPRRLATWSRHREPVARECPTTCSFPTTLSSPLSLSQCRMPQHAALRARLSVARASIPKLKHRPGVA